MSDDERLRRLLSDAVSDVEPGDRIDELRASVRSSSRVVPAARARSWYAAAGIGATAAVIGVVAFVTHVATDRSTDVGAATDGGTLPPSATATAIDTSLPSQSPGAGRGRAAVYYLGQGQHTTVLYRELSVPYPGASPLGYALTALMTEPVDPDYRTPWRPGWLVRATSDGHLITVQLGRAPTARPGSMTPRDATEAVQQVVYTLQDAVHRNEGVRFVRHGRPVASVLGVPTRKPVAAGRAVDVLSLMSISDPAEGARIPRGRLVVDGLNNAYEANVVVRLVRDGATYAERPGVAVGTYDPRRMFPWRVTMPTSALPPGRYRLVASNGSGDLGRDTRTIVLE
jgi:hypothetical protein